MSVRLSCLFVLPLLVWPSPEDDVFKPGNAIKEFGKIAAVESDVEIPKDTIFKVRFDVGQSNPKRPINRTFDSVARFINLKDAAGVPLENVHVAIVVHGSASLDVTQDDFYTNKYKDRKKNGSAEAIAQLQKHGVNFYICGQSAAYQGIEKKDLLPGVKVAHSAMTIHALLGQQGYSLNPF